MSAHAADAANASMLSRLRGQIRRLRLPARSRELGHAAGAAVPVSLSMAGLGLVTAAAWTVAMPLGLIAAGLSCWVAEWRISR